MKDGGSKMGDEVTVVDKEGGLGNRRGDYRTKSIDLSGQHRDRELFLFISWQLQQLAKYHHTARTKLASQAE